jgi:ribosomal-protein-alanine N-acetyltransferase
MGSRDLPLEFARPRDAAALALLSRDLIEAGLDWTYRPVRIAQMIADRDTAALVVRDGPRVAGFAFMHFGDERAHLALLAVTPAHRRQGIARRMLDWLLASARAAGMASVHVELRASNAPAFTLYGAAGFLETLREPRYYQGRETAVRMMRQLRRPGAAVAAWQPPTVDRR